MFVNTSLANVRYCDIALLELLGRIKKLNEKNIKYLPGMILEFVAHYYVNPQRFQPYGLLKPISLYISFLNLRMSYVVPWRSIPGNKSCIVLLIFFFVFVVMESNIY